MARSESHNQPSGKSIEQLVEFFETQDMGETWEQMPEVHFDIDLKRRKNLVTIQDDLINELASIAKSKRTSTIALINSWLREYILRDKHSKSKISPFKNRRSVIFIIYKDHHSEYRWRLCSTNNRVIAHSAMGFANKLDCQRQIDLTKQTFLEAGVVDETA